MRVEGLETLDYFDNLLQKERYTEQADAITFDGEVMFFFPFSPFLFIVLCSQISLRPQICNLFSPQYSSISIY